jgi:uncharacterized protein (TIGR03086 family)
MLNNELSGDPVMLYHAASNRAVAVVEAVRLDQLGWPTPCSEWTVQQLIDHLVGGTEYLLVATSGRPPVAVEGATSGDFRRGVQQVLAAVAQPGAMECICLSPLGFEWPVASAVAGTFMDVLIHTWDLARATHQDERLDPVLVEACTAMFVPEMPKRGREAGIIGQEVPVGHDAPAQDRLLAVMGRRP